ncbi:MAG: CHAT domain-containing protein [Desulfobaccales bacterium]
MGKLHDRMEGDLLLKAYSHHTQSDYLRCVRHFAKHYMKSPEVLQLKLDAEVVTLAACMTGVGRVMQGEGVLNFARAFQQAGARSVMVSLWNIPVDESMKFYSEFYKALKEGKSKIEALKVARQAVRAKEPHPYFWAGIILHGEG